MATNNNKRRAGWLIHPVNTVTTNVVLDTQPIILRSTFDGTVTVQCLLTPQPSPDQDPSPVWVDYLKDGLPVQVGISNTIVILAIPGVYRLNITGAVPSEVSYEEDARTIAWNTTPTSATAVTIPPGTAFKQYIPVLANGQTLFGLTVPAAAVDWSRFTLMVNGVGYSAGGAGGPGASFTLSGLTLTWLNTPFTLKTTDELFAVFI